MPRCPAVAQPVGAAASHRATTAQRGPGGSTPLGGCARLQPPGPHLAAAAVAGVPARPPQPGTHPAPVPDIAALPGRPGHRLAATHRSSAAALPKRSPAAISGRYGLRAAPAVGQSRTAAAPQLAGLAHGGPACQHLAGFGHHGRTARRRRPGSPSLAPGGTGQLVKSLPMTASDDRMPFCFYLDRFLTVFSPIFHLP